MTAKPLDWISWWSARLQMPEIWHCWLYIRDQADRAMVNALRSGEVHYRGEAYDLLNFQSVPLHDVVSTLRELGVYPDEARAEYETTEVTTTTFGSGFLRVSQPHTRKSVKVARIRRPELVWSEFRDYLIRFELPTGATLNKGRRDASHNHRTRPSGKAQRTGRQAQPIWRDIYPQIDAWLDANGCPIRGDGRQAKLERHVAEILQDCGQDAGEATIRRHVQRRINRYRARRGSGGS